MEALGVKPDAKDPEGGWFGRDANGRLDGRAFEYAQYPLERKVADTATDSELVEHVRAWSDEALSYGITSAQVMPWGNAKRFIDALARAKTPLRVRVIDFLDHGDTKTDAVKWILDGTPLERNAALRNEPYAAGGKGRLNFKDFAPMVRAAAASKRQLLVHAVGALQSETALKAFAQSPPGPPRIEHGDGSSSAISFRSVKSTGRVIVQNPSHFRGPRSFRAATTSSSNRS